MDIDILSLFPEYFEGPLNVSLLKRAIEHEHIKVELTNIRDYAKGPHRQVDDRPFGGGPGMVLMAEPVTEAIEDKRRADSHVVYLSPQGRPLDAKMAQELSKKTHLILLCGHYGGIDERILDHVDQEISIGDYVLTNGCLPALVLVDAMMRFIPDVVGHPDSVNEDSFQGGLLGPPQYTRPQSLEGRQVPSVLLNGNHAEIAKWRKEQALKKTSRVRPDLYDRYLREGEKP